MPKNNEKESIKIETNETLSSNNQLDTGTGGFTLGDDKLYTFDVGSNDPARTGGIKGTWSAGNISFEEDKKDISAGTKKTLADYLGKLTKNISTGPASTDDEKTIYRNYGKTNAFPISTDANEEQKKFLTDKEASELAARLTTKKWKYETVDIFSKTNSSPKDDAQTKLRETQEKKSPGFSPGERKFSEVSDTISGHDLLRSTDKPNFPVAKYSKALIDNRFSSENTYADESGLTNRQFLTSYAPGTSANPEEIGKNGVSFGQLSQVGAVLSSRASGEFFSGDENYNPANQLTELAAILPGWAQLGVGPDGIGINSRRLEARDVLQSLTDESIEEVQLINPNEKSWGSLNNVLEKYSGMGSPGMYVLAAVLIVAITLALELFMLLASYGLPDPLTVSSRPLKESDDSDRAPYGRSAPKNENLVFVRTHKPYKDCVRAGGLSLISDKSYGSGVGWAVVHVRVLVRAFLAIGEAIAEIASLFASGNIVAGITALAGFFDFLKTSKVVKCLNIFAQLGDILLAVSGGETLDNLASINGGGRKFSEIDANAKARGNLQDAYTANRLHLKDGQVTLAWSAHRSPDMFIMPTAFARIAAAGNSLGSPKLLPTANTLKYSSAYAATDESRIDTATRELMEAALNAEYLPFYFHDLRTNEIVSFHAFLTSLSDDYTAAYDSIDAYGRVEAIKNYKNTSRKIGLSFIVAATSDADFDSMWLKINKMTTLMYPQFNEGKKITGGTGEQEYSLYAPFSQQIAAAPMIRLRVGDLIQSNYSKFALARLFGYGNSGTKVSGTVAPQKLSKEKLDKLKQEMEAAKTKPEYKWKYDEFSMINLGNGTYISNPGKYFVRQFVKTEKENNFYKLVIADQAEFDKLPDVKKKIIQKEFIEANYNWVLKPENLKELTEDSLKQLLSTTGIVEDAVGDYDDLMKTFMSDEPNGNAIAKSFRSSGGRGLAGFIETMAFDWYDKVTWSGMDANGKKDRAPKMCKITIAFSPIHDITPGLDHNGFNRAPIYPVGPMNRRIAPAVQKPTTEAATATQEKK